VNVEIRIQAALAHQKGPLASKARFKVWRWGRRTGKTRGAFIAATMGHGAQPNGKGFLQGGEIIWIARDYPNADTIWRKEILRRFANKAGFKVNKQDRRVECEANGGSLTIYSADNIDSVRGGNWDGVIVDEAAHVDLDSVWNDVIRPGLADTKGWAIQMSTTYTASFFNALCERIENGEMGPAWECIHLTAFDNPKMDRSEIEDMVKEYVDEVKLKQEVFAELVVPGGFAFPEWDASVHVRKDEPPHDWAWAGCIDWNYVQAGWFGIAAVNGDRIAFRWGMKFQKIEPFDLGFRIGMTLRERFPRPVYIVCDSQMDASTQGHITIMGEVQAGISKAYGGEGPALIKGPKGPNSRIQSKILVHKLLRFEKNADGTVSPWKAPKMTFHPDCVDAISSIPRLLRDPNNPEDVDTKQIIDGPYDAIRYLAMMHAPPLWREGSDRNEYSPDRHPGFEEGARRKWAHEQDDDEPHTRYVRAS
jgi:hypothetical protein